MYTIYRYYIYILNGVSYIYIPLSGFPSVASPLACNFPTPFAWADHPTFFLNNSGYAMKIIYKWDNL